MFRFLSKLYKNTNEPIKPSDRDQENNGHLPRYKRWEGEVKEINGGAFGECSKYSKRNFSRDDRLMASIFKQFPQTKNKCFQLRSWHHTIHQLESVRNMLKQCIAQFDAFEWANNKLAHWDSQNKHRQENLHISCQENLQFVDYKLNLILAIQLWVKLLHTNHCSKLIKFWGFEKHKVWWARNNREGLLQCA